MAVRAGAAFTRKFAQHPQASGVRVANVEVPWVPRDVRQFVYRHPIQIARQEDAWVGGPVFAILAGSGNKIFHGNRGEYRDLLREGRRARTFVYVLPAASVNPADDLWRGYVRVGTGAWMGLPCPRPEAVYNRIPTRNLERTPTAERARALLNVLAIPMFNPSYFNKAEIYQVVANAPVRRFLPETAGLSKLGLYNMIQVHRSVYLKPSGGSVGHGIMLVSQDPEGYRLSVMKSSSCRSFIASNYETLWKAVGQHKLPGRYVLQAAKPLITWQDRPCDFRVLLQKHDGEWQVVGVGVRVAGDGAITTHVPNGGHIAAADAVIDKWFGKGGDRVRRRLEETVLEMARVIDRHYTALLGEMSMDMGIDPQGNIWFFEANSKPMKFDEPEIHKRSLQGVLEHLNEIRARHAVQPEL